MHTVLDDLIELLKLERIEDNIFRGDSRDIGSAQVFGGQVLGQALSAAQNTVEERVAHSLHAYFLRRGDMNAPIIYEVDRARDGGSFSTRRVVAIQHGRPIFNLAASFQQPEPGLSHQADKPGVPGPDGLKDLAEIASEHVDKLPEKLRRFMTDKRPFEFRPVEPVSMGATDPQPPVKHVWIRAVDALADDVALHQNLLAYVSDFELLGTGQSSQFSMINGNVTSSKTFTLTVSPLRERSTCVSYTGMIAPWSRKSYVIGSWYHWLRSASTVIVVVPPSRVRVALPSRLPPESCTTPVASGKVIRRLSVGSAIMKEVREASGVAPSKTRGVAP